MVIPLFETVKILIMKSLGSDFCLIFPFVSLSLTSTDTDLHIKLNFIMKSQDKKEINLSS